MTKKQHTIYGVGGLIIGIIGGIAGTAFSLGADRQRINDTIIRHTTEITNIEKTVDIKITDIQGSIANITIMIGDLRTDVQVLKALMERIEKDHKNQSN
jgi:hypothetical protein